MIPDATPEDVILVVAPGATVEGTVSDAQGRALAGTSVSAMWAFSMRRKSTITGADGSYRVGGLPSGSLQVMAMDMNALQQGGMAGFMSSLQTKNVEVQAGSTTVVNFGGIRRGARLHGTVLENGKPKKGIMLLLTNFERADGRQESGQRFAATDAQGAYAFEDLPAGRATLLVMRTSADSQSFQESTVTIQGDAEQRHDVELSTGSIEGRVTTEDGKPAGQHPMTLFRKIDGGGEDMAANAQTDSEGRYRFDGLREGTYTVRAGESFLSLNQEGRFSRAERSDLHVADGASLERIDFVLARGGSLSGRVEDRSGKPLDGVSVFVARAEDEWNDELVQGVSLGAGRYRVTGLSPGAIKVRVRAPGYIPVEKSNIWIESERDTDVNFTLDRGVRVVVVIEDDLGNVLTNARSVRAWLETPTGERNPALLGIEELLQRFGGAVQTGAYELGSFAPGTYVLHVVAEGFAPLRQEVGIAQTPNFQAELRVRLKRP